MVIEFFIIIAITFCTSFWAVSQLCKPTSKFHIADLPNERSLHENPTPRNGGLGVILAISVAYALSFGFRLIDTTYLPIGFAIALLAVTGYFDDRFNLRSSLRFAIHFAAAGITIFSLGAISSIPLPFAEIKLGYSAIPFTLLFIVWMINLYNFMDGMDGFSGGMTFFGFSTLAAILFIQGYQTTALLSFIPAIAAAGFLIFNFPPAKIFLGDSGSTVLGYLAAVFMLRCQNEDIVPIWVSTMVFSPFIADATATLLSRILKKERFWEAHRSHFYQRLVLTGLTHRNVLFVEYLLMIGVAVLAIATSLWPESTTWVLGTWIATFILLGILVNRYIHKRVARTQVDSNSSLTHLNKKSDQRRI